MRIIQIIDQLGAGGAERVCVNLVNLFARKGYNVKLIVLDQKGQLFQFIDENVEVVVLNKSKNKLLAYKKIVAEVQVGEIIHVHMRQTHRFLQKAFLLFGKRKKVILHDHYGKIGINQKVPLLYKSLFKPTIYIGCSQLLKTWAVSKMKLNSEDIFLINNFVLKQTSPIDCVEPSGLVLVANLKKVKNHIFAIKLSKHLDQDLTIYCAHTRGDYYEQIRQIIETLDYTNRVHFVTGCINVQAELKKYKVGLLTSISEGDSLVVIEYLAQGIPCLVTNVGEAVKVIKETFPYMVLDNYDLKNWEDSYHKALKIKPNEIQNLFDTHYSQDYYLNQYLEVYNRLLQKD